MRAPTATWPRWYKDIGSRVEKGQLLADIETPEIDQELMQARAARDQAEAQLSLAKTSAERWETLRKMDAVAQQETDEKTSGYTQGASRAGFRHRECAPAGTARIVQAHLCSIFGNHHTTQHRHRRFDQCRQQRIEPGAFCDRAA